MRRRLILAVGCLCGSSALAQVSVYSARPDAVSLTIYREGLALVTETRRVQLPAEPVTLVFQGVVDSLLARSAVMNGAGRPIAQTDLRFDRLTPASLLQRSVGKVVTVVRTAPRTGKVSRLEATVVSAGQGVVLRSVEGGEALYCSGLPEHLEFAEIPGELTPTPTLSVQLAGGMAGLRTITISYLAQGFSWSADYLAHLDASSRRMHLAGWLTLHNDTGSRFEQAQVQVVAGRLNLLDADSGGSRPGRSDFDEDQIDEQTGLAATRYDQLREEEADRIGQQLTLLHDCFALGKSTDGLLRGLPDGLLRRSDALSDENQELSEVMVTGSRIVDSSQLGDYQMYRLPWLTDLNARQTKQAAFLDKPGIKVERFYSVRIYGFDTRNTYPDDASILTLRWRNERSAGLGEPLPAGQVRVFEPQAGGEVFAGEARITDHPAGLPVEIGIARALDLAAEFTLDDEDEQHKGDRDFVGIRASHRFVNNKDAPVSIEVRRTEQGNFTTPVVVRSNLRARRERGALVWRFELPAGGEQWLRYELKAEQRRY